MFELWSLGDRKTCPVVKRGRKKVTKKCLGVNRKNRTLCSSVHLLGGAYIIFDVLLTIFEFLMVGKSSGRSKNVRIKKPNLVSSCRLQNGYRSAEVLQEGAYVDSVVNTPQFLVGFGVQVLQSIGGHFGRNFCCR